jgi:release factor glutamine methyltransferase
LSGGADGLDVLRGVVSGAGGWLAAGGTLLVETGATQAAEIAALMAGAGLRTRTAESAERCASVVIGAATS